MSLYQDIFQPIGIKYALKEEYIPELSKTILQRTCISDNDYYVWGKDIATLLYHNKDFSFRKECSTIIRQLHPDSYLNFYRGFADGQYNLFYGKII